MNARIVTLALAAGLALSGCAASTADKPATAGAQAAGVTSPKAPVKIAKPAGPKMTAGQSNARRSAESYLSMQGFSRAGLIKQLVFEKYTTADATFAVDSLKVDFNKQATKAGKSYLDQQAFSRQGLITQLKFDGFSQAQAEAGATGAGL